MPHTGDLIILYLFMLHIIPAGCGMTFAQNIAKGDSKLYLYLLCNVLLVLNAIFSIQIYKDF